MTEQPTLIDMSLIETVEIKKYCPRCGQIKPADDVEILKKAIEYLETNNGNQQNALVSPLQRNPGR